jgi:hypothetical protein
MALDLAKDGAQPRMVVPMVKEFKFGKSGIIFLNDTLLYC